MRIPSYIVIALLITLVDVRMYGQADESDTRVAVYGWRLGSGFHPFVGASSGMAFSRYGMDK